MRSGSLSYLNAKLNPILSWSLPFISLGDISSASLIAMQNSVFQWVKSGALSHKKCHKNDTNNLKMGQVGSKWHSLLSVY